MGQRVMSRRRVEHNNDWDDFMSQLPVENRCDQEVSKRTLATPHKVCEEVSNKETRNQLEPCDVQVSLPRRADE